MLRLDPLPIQFPPLEQTIQEDAEGGDFGVGLVGDGDVPIGTLVDVEPDLAPAHDHQQRILSVGVPDGGLDVLYPFPVHRQVGDPPVPVTDHASRGCGRLGREGTAEPIRDRVDRLQGVAGQFGEDDAVSTERPRGQADMGGHPFVPARPVAEPEDRDLFRPLHTPSNTPRRVTGFGSRALNLPSDDPSAVTCPEIETDLSGQTVLVTGATSGIGRETGLGLARLGADVLVHGRDVPRGRRAVRAIEATGAEAEFLPADFADLDEVRDLAGAVRDRVDRLDVLVNNAGAHVNHGELNEDGIERTFAINHLAPFLLTKELRGSIPDAGRVVTVASRVHRRGRLGLDRIRSVDGYDGFAAYARSKLANVLFTRELDRREPAIDSNCLHPGFVPGSALWRNASLPVRAFMRGLDSLPTVLVRPFATTPRAAAKTPIYLAASPAVAGVSGEYFVACERRRPAERARDDELARRLWEESLRMID